MGKKNRKVSPTQKPFWVLSRRAVLGWLAVILFICGWMFAIGVIVGRDDLPEEFDINPLRKELEPLRKKLENEGTGQVSTTPGSGTGRTDLDFYEALPQDREDAEIAVKTGPPGQKAQVEPKPPTKAKTKAKSSKKTAPKIKRSMKRLTKAGSKSKQQVSASKRQVAPASQLYTIQVAAFKKAGDAEKLVDKLKRNGFAAYRALGKVPGKGIWYRVRVGEFKDKAEAGKPMANLKKLGYKPALVEK